MTLACSSFSEQRLLDGELARCVHPIIRVTYRDNEGHTQKQFGAVVSNEKDTLVVGVGLKHATFYWSKTGRNSIIRVEIISHEAIAGILHHSAMLIEATPFYTLPWENR